MSKLVAYTNGFKFVNTKDEAIQYLVDNNLGFGWFNGEFITNPTI
jgi:hypothetical protein